MRLKSLLLMCAVALGMSAQAREYKYVTVPNDITHTRIYRLDNGLTVYLSVNKEKPRLQTYIAVRTGSRNDPAETTGLAHYLEHIMFKGTKQFGTSDFVKEAPLLDSIQNRYEQYRHVSDPLLRKAIYHKIDSLSQVAAQYNIPNEYDKLMAAIGSQGSNAYTSNDVTCYTEDIPANEIENWAKIQADRFQNMVIRGFHTELETVYEEYNMSLTRDIRKEYEALLKNLFPTHPYGMQTTLGTQTHLKNPSIVNIKNYFNRYYVPNNIAICMAGDFDPDTVMGILDKYFGSWQSSKTLSHPTFPAVKSLTSPTYTTVIGQDAENVMIGWTFKGSASLQADTLDLVTEMLSNGKAGLFDLNLSQPMKYLDGGAYVYSFTDYDALIANGYPKESQSLDEVKDLMLGEIDKLKKGDFSDDLLLSVVNNMKLRYYYTIESNEGVADMYVDAFVNGKQWSDVVGKLNRVSGITKQQIVDFANKYFGENYAVVYKKQGVDSTQVKIDKPAITPIPANREMSSEFLNEIENTKTTPISPRFLDFKKDLTVTETSNNIPLLYKQNTTNGVFGLSFVFDFGKTADNRLDVAAGYLDYLGTDKLTPEQIKQQFYKYACTYNISVDEDQLYVNLSGLSENMPQALALMQELINNAKVDTAAYNKYVGMIIKSRNDAKLNQTTNYWRLMSYGMYGSHNVYTDMMSAKQLRETNPQVLLDLIKGISKYEQTIMYYGPAAEQELSAVLKKAYKTPNTLQPVPVSIAYTEQTTPTNEILIAPYDAKNIYISQYHNENKQWSPVNAPVQSMFNEYFGGGMNSIVFQELRETRGLAYSASARYQRPSSKGRPELYYTYIVSQNDKLMDCINTFNNILDTIPQSQPAFNLAKQSLQKSLATARTTKSEVLSRYYNLKRLGLDYDINQKIYEALPTLKLEDIVKFEQENMAHKPYKYLILGDEKNLDMEALGKIGSIKRLTTEQIFGY